MSQSVQTKLQFGARKSVSKQKKSKQVEIPSDFIKHIKNLGFDEKDASRLYASKDDWMGMSTGGKILCTGAGCKFETTLASDCLFQHCRDEHDWGDYPCTHDNCQYVAFSSTNLKQHRSHFHSLYAKHKFQGYPCNRRNCKASFEQENKLLQHMKIHDNDVVSCVFCPYRNAEPVALIRHQRLHFNSRDYKCTICKTSFTTQSALNSHTELRHLNETTKCPLCKFTAPKIQVGKHLLRLHKLYGTRWDKQSGVFIVPKQLTALVQDKLE